MLQDLQKELIRLGSTVPSVRSHIRPILTALTEAGESTKVARLDRTTEDDLVDFGAKHPEIEEDILFVLATLAKPRDKTNLYRSLKY